MKAKSSTQMGHIDVFFTRCLPIAFTPTSALLFTSEREFSFWLNCSNFAVECDWNSKISQNVQKFGVFFKKKQMGFSKKILNFFEIPKGGKFAVESVSNGIIS